MACKIKGMVLSVRLPHKPCYMVNENSPRAKT
jgi:hypothetical protein